jgi:hypothetical protein
VRGFSVVPILRMHGACNSTLLIRLCCGHGQLYLDSSNEGRDMFKERGRRHGFNPMSVKMGFVVDKVALEQSVFPEYFGFPLSVYIHHCSIFMYHRRCNISSW